MRKISPAIAAGAAVLTFAGATVGYAVVRKDVQLTVDGSSRQVSTVAGTVDQVLAAEDIEIGQHDVVVPSPDAEVAAGTSIAVQHGRQVTITVDGTPRTFWTTATTVEQALDAHRIEVDGDDYLSTSRSSAIGRDGLAITVSSPKQVTIDNAGKKQKLTTAAPTVGAALLEAKIVFDADDEVSPGVDTPLTDGAAIRYTRVDTKVVTKRSRVGFETTYKNTKKLDEGQTKVIRKGVPGVRTTASIEDRRNGELDSKQLLISNVTTKPQDQVVLRGTRPIKSVLEGGKPADVGNGGGTRSQIFTTGYTYWDNTPPGSAQIARPVIHERAGGTGTWKDPITVAVQAGRFDFGTRFYLPELKKYFIVEDLCGACHDGRNGGAYTLDIWVDGSHLSSGGAASCASRITRLQPAIEDPKRGLPVSRGSVC
ncbi:MAG: ubiquitin-like domain-containing protein [Microlunatus sp.]